NPFSDALVAVRNFYGLMRVKEWESPSGRGSGYSLIHGVTSHGIQYLAPAFKNEPTIYYTRESGIGYVLANHPKVGDGLRLGVLGLGIGTMVAYTEEGDVVRFYEINPEVVEYAEGKDGYFSFLSDSKADVTVVTDDARLALERELTEGNLQNFDVLVLDT